MFGNNYVIGLSISILTGTSLITMLMKLRLAVVTVRMMLIPYLKYGRAIYHSLVLRVYHVTRECRYEYAIAPGVRIALYRRMLIAINDRVMAIMTVLYLHMFITINVLRKDDDGVTLHMMINCVMILGDLSMGEVTVLHIRILNSGLARARRLAFVTIAFSILVLGNDYRS